MKKARMLAWAMAAAMAVTGAAGSASAATSFSQVEKDTWAEQLEAIRNQPETEKSGKGSVGVNVTLGEMGKGLASMFSPVDVSWLSTADISIDTTVADGETKGLVTVSVNDKEIAHARVLADMKTLDFKVQIPELSEGVLAGNYTDVAADAEATVSSEIAEVEESTELSPEDITAMMQVVMNLSQNPPAKDTVVTLLDRYVTMCLDSFEDGETEDFSYTVGDITQEATVVNGTMTEAGAMELTRKVLEAVKDDAELKTVLEGAAAGTSYEGVLYEKLQSGAEDLLGELGGAEAEEKVLSHVKLIVDAEGTTIGSESYMETDEGEQQLVSVHTAKDGDRRALEAEVTATVNEESMLLGLSGEGTVADGMLTGEYVFTMDGTPVAKITANQTDKEKGSTDPAFEGHYTITPIVPEVESEDAEESANSVVSMLEGFSLLADVNVDANGGSLGLDVTMGGSSLAKVVLRGGESAGAEFEIPADASTYALTDDDAMGNYLGTADLMGLIGNLMDAGMPEEFLDQLLGGGEESTEDYEAEEEPAA